MNDWVLRLEFEYLQPEREVYTPTAHESISRESSSRGRQTGQTERSFCEFVGDWSVSVLEGNFPAVCVCQALVLVRLSCVCALP